MFLTQRPMIEPGVRYHPHPAIQTNIPSHITLEAAVDLTKKSEDWRPPSAEQDADDGEDRDDSDSDTPLDMSVSASRLTPVFPGFRRDHSPARSDRSEHGSRGGPGYFSPVPGARDWSTERSEADKDEFPKDGCHLCGMPRSEMAAHDHVEGACNQRPISCLLCSKTFTLWSHYESHKKCHQKLKQRQYPCASCGKIFTSASNRNMHQRIHKGVRPFHCIPCGVFFRQKAHLQKHQRTQGHIQAVELFDKRRAEGGIIDHEPVPREDLEGSESLSEEGSPAVHSSSSSVNEDEGVALAHIKTSPKRKQSHPQHSLHHKYILRDDEDEGIEEEDERLSPREDIIRHSIEFNSLTQEYECRECDYSSEDHAATREHFELDHMRDSTEYQCSECMLTFTKLFNLQIHQKKHETSDPYLSCEFCEQPFKAANKLIKHMEVIHHVCPTCGERADGKHGLLDHMEKVHNEIRKGIHINIQHLSNLSSLLPAKHRFDIDSRHAKMRKLDTLAEHIRAKQLQNANGTNVINGNDKSGPHLDPMPRSLSLHRSIDDHHYTKPGIQSLVTQLHRSNSPLNLNLKSENNNILSSISKMDLKHEYSKEHQALRQQHHLRQQQQLHQRPQHDRDELTPPCSPPVADARITSNVVLINNNPTPESDDSNETGLDLTVKKDKFREDNEVTTTEIKKEDEPYHRGARILTPSFPYIVPNLPFLPRVPIIGSLQPHNNTFTEHLFKLASISRPTTVVTAAQNLAKPINSTPTGHHTVLSAMLGHRPPVPPPSAAFPVFGGNLPPSMFPQHPLPPRNEEKPLLLQAKDSKPFRCTYCPKEFGHLSSLESHIDRLHTNESKHHCEACGRAFSSKSNLTAHKKIHTGERPFQCGVCQKKFRQKAHLQKHETTHSSATPYQCPHCDKAFGHPSNLNTHIATHSDVRPYECTDCGKAYKDSASFKRHRLVHSGERPHMCTVCSESFIDSKSLKRHREIAGHPSEPRGDMDDEDEELIEPGQEEQYIPGGGGGGHGESFVSPHHPHGREMVRVGQYITHRSIGDREEHHYMPHRVEREEEVGGHRDQEEDYQDDDLASSNEGDLEIAETSADSGINSSMENHGNQPL
jgi:uncharacterized Zn-finger protein